MSESVNAANAGTVTIGGNAFTEEIQKQLGIAADEAEAYKVGGSQTEDGVVPQEVLRVMDGVSRPRGSAGDTMARTTQMKPISAAA